MTTKVNGSVGVEFPDSSVQGSAVSKSSGAIAAGLTSQIGTIGDGTWTGFWYEVGGLVYIEGRITITSVNTGSGGLILDLPGDVPQPYVTGTSGSTGSGRWDNTGKMLQVLVSGTDLLVFNYDNTTTIGVGTGRVSITYRKA